MGRSNCKPVYSLKQRADEWDCFRRKRKDYFGPINRGLEMDYKPIEKNIQPYY